MAKANRSVKDELNQVLAEQTRILISNALSSDTIIYIKEKIRELKTIQAQSGELDFIIDAIERLNERIHTLKKAKEAKRKQEEETHSDLEPSQDTSKPPFRNPLQIELYNILTEEGAQTRSALVEKTNTPRTTVYDNLKKLQTRRIIESYPKNNGERGRPKVFWKIHHRFGGQE